jgi:serine/threonine-protein kinase
VSLDLGVVGVGVGSYFGVRAIQKHGDPGATCTTNPCSTASTSLNSDAKTAADISTVSFVAALVGLGVGGVLWFTDTRASPDKPRVSVVPALGPGRGGMNVSGTF